MTPDALAKVLEKVPELRKMNRNERASFASVSPADWQMLLDAVETLAAERGEMRKALDSLQAINNGFSAQLFDLGAERKCLREALEYIERQAQPGGSGPYSPLASTCLETIRATASTILAEVK